MPRSPRRRGSFIIVTQRGAVKKVALGEFEPSSRAKRGVVVVREVKSNPHRVVGAVFVRGDEEMVGLRTEKGVVETIEAASLRPLTATARVRLSLTLTKRGWWWTSGKSRRNCLEKGKKDEV
ncbi:DNA topoisomerase 4 subunit A [Geobacillus sp. BCO2]|nr:DNA topoisomerase 4 subunit A [Geobacillus sp. BCO2]